MSILKRGEIWYVRISDPETSRAAVGTEMGAKREESCRLCVVVSSSDANECSSRVTVVPLTKYMDKKEISMGPGGFRVEHGRDVEFDANNENHAEGRLESGASYLSLVNCAQLWTLYAPTETEQGVDPDLPNDILQRRLLPNATARSANWPAILRDHRPDMGRCRS